MWYGDLVMLCAASSATAIRFQISRPLPALFGPITISLWRSTTGRGFSVVFPPGLGVVPTSSPDRQVLVGDLAAGHRVDPDEQPVRLGAVVGRRYVRLERLAGDVVVHRRAV